MPRHLLFILTILAFASPSLAQERPKIKSYEAALKLNPKKTPAEVRDFDATTAALAAIR